MNSELVRQLTQECFSVYENVLTKNGKPINGKEWTVLSAIVKDETTCGKDSQRNLKFKITFIITFIFIYLKIAVCKIIFKKNKNGIFMRELFLASK